jgi:hypothetical protein
VHDWSVDVHSSLRATIGNSEDRRDSLRLGGERRKKEKGGEERKPEGRRNHTRQRRLKLERRERPSDPTILGHLINVGGISTPFIHGSHRVFHPETSTEGHMPTPRCTTLLALQSETVHRHTHS